MVAVGVGDVGEAVAVELVGGLGGFSEGFRSSRMALCGLVATYQPVGVEWRAVAAEGFCFGDFGSWAAAWEFFFS